MAWTNHIFIQRGCASGLPAQLQQPSGARAALEAAALRYKGFVGCIASVCKVLGLWPGASALSAVLLVYALCMRFDTARMQALTWCLRALGRARQHSEV